MQKSKHLHTEWCDYDYSNPNPCSTSNRNAKQAKEWKLPVCKNSLQKVVGSLPIKEQPNHILMS